MQLDLLAAVFKYVKFHSFNTTLCRDIQKYVFSCRNFTVGERLFSKFCKNSFDC